MLSDPDFGGYIKPPDVPPDPSGEDWRGPAGPQGPPGPVPPDAPTDGVIYGRGGATPTWVPTLPLAGGTVSGATTFQTGVTVTGGAALAANYTNFGRGFTYTYSGQTNFSTSLLGVWANNNVAGTFAGSFLPAVGQFTAAGMNISAASATVPVLGIAANTGGASATAGQWEGIEVDLNDTSATNDFAGGGRGVWVAAQITRRASKNQGGTGLTPSTAFGQNWGIDIIAGALSGATNLALLNGLEINCGISSGASVVRRASLQLSNQQAPVRGAMWDNEIASLRDTTSAKFINGICFGGALSGTSPAANDSKLITHELAQDHTATANIGLEWNDVTFTTASIRVPGFAVDPNGVVGIGTTYLTAGSTGLAIDAKGSIGTGTPTINAGGSGYPVSSTIHADDGYGGVYTLTVNASGVVTAVAAVVRQPVYPTTSPPATIAVTGRAPSTGTGCVLNGSWATTRTRLDLNPSGGQVTVGGPLGGINFGSNLDSGPGSAAQHIWLYGSQYGVGVTGNRLNLISGNSVCFVFSTGAVDYFTVTNAGLLTLGTTSQNRLTATPGAASTNAIVLGQSGTGGIQVNGNMGFNSTAPIAKPTVSGAKGGNAALASLLTALASYGLVTDTTTA